MDMHRLLLLDALRQAAAPPGEHRLYQSGKLPGLFAGRTRLHAAVADRAVRDGLLEVARVDTKGKVSVEWVRATPKGVDFLVKSESPVRALEDLHAALAVNADGLPAWVTEIRQQIETLQRHVAAEVEAIGRRLEQLSARVLEAIDRLEQAHGVKEPEALSWGQEVMEVLTGRAAAGLGDPCPLADLFAALKERQVDLTVKDFHLGLRGLQDRGRIELLPHAGPGAPPGPEYALLDGTAVYYYVGLTPTP
jgi:hypothetical protein